MTSSNTDSKARPFFACCGLAGGWISMVLKALKCVFLSSSLFVITLFMSWSLAKCLPLFFLRKACCLVPVIESSWLSFVPSSLNLKPFFGLFYFSCSVRCRCLCCLHGGTELNYRSCLVVRAWIILTQGMRALCFWSFMRSRCSMWASCGFSLKWPSFPKNRYLSAVLRFITASSEPRRVRLEGLVSIYELCFSISTATRSPSVSKDPKRIGSWRNGDKTDIVDSCLSSGSLWH